MTENQFLTKTVKFRVKSAALLNDSDVIEMISFEPLGKIWSTDPASVSRGFSISHFPELKANYAAHKITEMQERMHRVRMDTFDRWDQE